MEAQEARVTNKVDLIKATGSLIVDRVVQEAMEALVDQALVDQEVQEVQVAQVVNLVTS